MLYVILIYLQNDRKSHFRHDVWRIFCLNKRIEQHNEKRLIDHKLNKNEWKLDVIKNTEATKKEKYQGKSKHFVLSDENQLDTIDSLKVIPPLHFRGWWTDKRKQYNYNYPYSHQHRRWILTDVHDRPKRDFKYFSLYMYYQGIF